MKIIHRVCLLAALVFYCDTALSAGTYDTRDAELKMRNQKLNSAYQELMNSLDHDRQKYLREAQRAWLKMRDNDCEWAYVDVRDCLIDRTENRTSELTNSWFQTKNGEYKSLE